jgi:hypothetical protein
MLKMTVEVPYVTSFVMHFTFEKGGYVCVIDCNPECPSAAIQLLKGAVLDFLGVL